MELCSLTNGQELVEKLPLELRALEFLLFLLHPKICIISLYAAALGIKELGDMEGSFAIGPVSGVKGQKGEFPKI